MAKNSLFPEAENLTAVDLMGVQGGLNKRFPIALMDAKITAAIAAAITALLASEAEAEEGTEGAKLMTPLRVAQAIAELVPALVTSGVNAVLDALPQIVAVGEHTVPVGDNGEATTVAAVSGVLSTDILIAGMSAVASDAEVGADTITWITAGTFTTGDTLKYVVIRNPS